MAREHEPEEFPTLLNALGTLYPEPVVDQQAAPTPAEHTAEATQPEQAAAISGAERPASPTGEAVAVDVPQLQDELD